MPAAIRVLVVDDEENIVFLVESALQLQGYDHRSRPRRARGARPAGRVGDPTWWCST
jgi:DNA-binding response OmpR family regulator